MIRTSILNTAFHAGDEVVLRTGTYQGTSGTFLRLREDGNWADVAERNGTTRCHPVAWLALAPRAMGTSGQAAASVTK